MILSGSASQSLASALGRVRDEPVVPLSYDRFPDGERLVAIDRSAPMPAGVTLTEAGARIEEPVTVVASTPTPDAILEVLQLQDLAREAEAPSVTTVIPYFGYARQDVAHEPGQPASARAIARAIETGTDRFLTVNPHEERICAYFDIPAEAVSAASALADGFDLGAEPVILAPDAGARSLAHEVRDTLGRGEVDHFEKERVDGETVDIYPHEVAVTDREVVVVDDIIATGSTIASASAHLTEQGAAAVHVGCVHPVFAGGAYTRVRNAGVSSIVATDTLERSVTDVSAATSIARALADSE